MDLWKLPTSLNVSGKEYRIRTDYRAVLDILSAMNDDEIFEPGMNEEEKNKERMFTLLQILYIDFENLHPNDYEEAINKGCEFIDCGFERDEKKHRPQLMDWKKDASIVIPAINKVVRKDIRAEEYMHWWTFLSAFLEIGESTFSTIISIRDKKAKGKKLEKWEEEYYKEHKAVVDLTKKKFERSEEEKRELRKIFGFKEKLTGHQLEMFADRKNLTVER